MKKIIGTVAMLSLFLVSAPAFASTSTCGDPSLNTLQSTIDAHITYVICAGVSPESVVNTWGTTNSQLPNFAPGQTMTLANGSTYTCPAWFGLIKCVDVTATAWYKTTH